MVRLNSDLIFNIVAGANYSPGCSDTPRLKVILGSSRGKRPSRDKGRDPEGRDPFEVPENNKVIIIYRIIFYAANRRYYIASTGAIPE